MKIELTRRRNHGNKLQKTITEFMNQAKSADKAGIILLIFLSRGMGGRMLW